MKIKALDQQPCEDCISRQEAISAIQDEYYADATGIDIVDIIAHLPPVQPTRPTGKWGYVQYDYNPNIGNWHCSECRFMFVMSGVPEYKYCPNCGAKMNGAETEVEY